MQHVETIRALLQRVRTRWRLVRLFEGMTRAALAASCVIGVALLSARFITAPLAFGLVGLVAALAAAAALAWGLAPARTTPSDRQVARFIEERTAALDDNLASAVDLVSVGQASPGPMFADAVLAAAARRAASIDVDGIVPGRRLRRRGMEAVAAGILLLFVMLAARGLGRQTIDALALVLFPSRVGLEVVPGDARVQTGKPLTIRARLVGSRAPVVARVLIAEATRSRTADMTTDQAGEFHLGLDAVTSGFTYKVTAGSLVSREYTVTVASPPRVARIDIDYTYPPALGLPPRTDEDSGDIYAPEGTDVRVRVHVDRPIAAGNLALADGQSIRLTETAPAEYSASLKLVDDNSYRVAMTDREGLVNPGETDYFIRTLEDRPPQVRVVKPAADRGVSPLEEVDIEAQADDDFGIARMDLVYAVRGRGEKVVPLAIPSRVTTVEARRTLFLEDLGVHPGDFVSYYVRAFDVSRGKAPNEARSDIFFLDVRPFEQEFVVSQGQTGSSAKGVDDLVTAQKEVVVATWKLERRAEAAKGARSEQDVRAVARAEAELKARVEETASGFRERTMRNPQQPQPPGPGGGGNDAGGRPGTAAPAAGKTLPEEDAMTAASAAMGQAVTWLTALNTRDAVPPEMDALTSLLKAQGDVKRREVPKPQNGNASGNGPVETNSNYDMSALFDKELRRIQQTNYENSTESQKPKSAEEQKASALDRIKDLARRQDELLKRQQELARNRGTLGDEAAKRELETLTREESELRQRAEDLAAQPGANDESGRAMREASQEMSGAAGELRRQDPAQASARSSRALDKLREAQRQLGSRGPDDRKRALGDMQLEARQLADAERRIANDMAGSGQGQKSQDEARRLAGEQDALADRTRKLQEGLKEQDGREGQAGKNAPADAARAIEQQRLVERMQKSAADMRASAGREGASPGPGARPDAADERAIARALDKAAQALASAAGEGGDAESRKLSEQLSRTRDLRERLDGMGMKIEEQKGTRGANDQAGRSAPGTPASRGEPGRSGEGQRGGAGADPGKLGDEFAQQLQETRQLLDELARQNPGGSQGSGGGTPIGQGMVLSAPGTEGFKQDFAKWDPLRRQATAALEQAEAALSKQLRAAQTRDRLAAGVADTAPPGYQQQVDSYFKAIAGKKK